MPSPQRPHPAVLQERASAESAAFVAAVWAHYRDNGRDLPWRRTRDAYEILVSEVMLQQTQVARVLVKYAEFLAAFPTIRALAVAPVADLLAVWSGLGYNRRALALQRAAQTVLSEHEGVIPASPDRLRALPGIGPATAAAVSVFAHNRPQAFIETNIRAAFIHFFFPGRACVSDAEILPLVETTMDRERPREWFYALMDYGVWTKKAHANPSRRSRHHAVQPPLAGSRRELRSHVLRALLSIAPAPAAARSVHAMLPPPARDLEEVVSVLDDLSREGFLKKGRGGYQIA